MFSRLTHAIPLAMPRPHFMGLAPLDVWARVLLAPAARVPVRYWLRLAAALATSALATVLTLPERLVLGPLLAWQGRRREWRLDLPVVVVLGYYRSGTTHLHYLLSCDPRFRTPAWCETLAPCGFAASWWFLRWFLVPFLSNTRPQDDVALGPEWPAEDDFALCNGAAASCLIGRMVAPSRHGHYERFHALDGLTAREFARWRRGQWAFLWKVAALSRGRELLLKSPSHTARVDHLLDLLGAENVRFVHIRRDAGAVVRSNVAMDGRMEPQLIQDAPGAAVSERWAREQLAATEEKYARTRGLIPAGRLCEITFDELVSRPVETVERVYSELGLELTRGARVRMGAYLESVRDYRAQSEPDARSKERTGSADEGEEPSRRGGATERRSGWVASLAGAGAAAAAAWVGLAWLMADRSDWLVWPVGVVLGVTAMRSGGRGSVRLGLFAAAATVLVMLAAAWPATLVAEYGPRNPNPLREQWHHVWLSTYRGLLAMNNVFWGFMGVVTAYRFGSRRHAAPPGRGGTISP
ncbi:MAG: sulfotransferase [Phycisphaerales bacterium]|nr:sulfotransferase [Phycisphaerales bacterium]